MRKLLQSAFDTNEDCSVTFLLQVKSRDEKTGWGTGLGDTMTIRDSKCISQNLISKYVQPTLCDIKDSLANYYTQPNGAALNSEAFSLFLHMKKEM